MSAILILLSALLHSALCAAPATLTLSPSETVVGVGGTDYFLAVYDPDGADWGLPQFLDPSQVRWWSSNPSVLAVDPTGSVHGKRVGLATVTARDKRLVAKARVTVAGSVSSCSLVTPDKRVRTYLLYVPAGYRPSKPAPLVLAYHGSGGSGADLMHTSQLNSVAHQHAVVVAYPQGTGASPSWNGGGCCGQAVTDHVDDVEFTRLMIDDIESRLKIDSRRVYATGFSNGGVMVNRLAVELSDRIAAISSVSGEISSPGGDFVLPPPPRPVSVMLFHGTTDEDAPYAPQTMDSIVHWWVNRDGITAASPTISYQQGIATCNTYASATGEVTWCLAAPPAKIDVGDVLYDGGGHAWPGGSKSNSPGADVPTPDISASAAMWDFFSRHPMR